MKLLVIGSTGRTGKHVVEQAVQRGHAVTAFTRRPQLLAEQAGLAAIEVGDALNSADLQRAVQGQEAVISIVAPPDLGPTTLVSAATRNLITAMQTAGVPRLVITSSRSIRATRPWLAVRLAWLVFRNAYRDLAVAEDLVRASRLEWSIVRATMLTDRPPAGRVHTDEAANATGGDWQLSRADYAMALLDAVENPQLIGRAIGVNGHRAERRPESAAHGKERVR
jgi:putative NADH-flavin reductase